MNDNDIYAKLGAHQAAMEHEQGIRSSYQNLLITVESILFGLTFTLAQLQLQAQNWILAFTAVLIGVVLGAACEYRARNVDIWRRNIVRLIKGTELEKAFYEGNYRWHPLRQPWLQYLLQYFLGHWFERIVVLLILAGWLFSLWWWPKPFIVLVLSIAFFVFWFSYTFRLLSFRGGRMPDKLTY